MYVDPDSIVSDTRSSSQGDAGEASGPDNALRFLAGIIARDLLCKRRGGGRKNDVAENCPEGQMPTHEDLS